MHAIINGNREVVGMSLAGFLAIPEGCETVEVPGGIPEDADAAYVLAEDGTLRKADDAAWTLQP